MGFNPERYRNRIEYGIQMQYLYRCYQCNNIAAGHCLMCSKFCCKSCGGFTNRVIYYSMMKMVEFECCRMCRDVRSVMWELTK